MAKLPQVFIVILNWNRPRLTLECLESLTHISAKKCGVHIVVVDNGSTDDSAQKLAQYFLKNATYKLLQNGENLGFAEGNNKGIEYALENGADYVMILNNDTELDKNLVEALLSSAKKNKKAGIISPKIYFAKGYEFHKDRYKKSELGKVIWAVGGDIDWDNIYATNRGVDEVDRGQYDDSCEVDFASGACMFVSRESLEKIGMFDKKYFMYLEDVDLSQRMKKHGYTVLYEPEALLWHKVAQSSAIGGDLNDYFITRNRLLFGVGMFGNGYARFRTKLALTREALRLWTTGRKWQKIGVRDFYFARFGKGSWK